MVSRCGWCTIKSLLWKEFQIFSVFKYLQGALVRVVWYNESNECRCRKESLSTYYNGMKNRNVVCKYESAKPGCIKCVCITVHWEMRNWGLNSGISLRLSWLMFFVQIAKCICQNYQIYLCKSSLRNAELRSEVRNFPAFEAFLA